MASPFQNTKTITPDGVVHSITLIGTELHIDFDHQPKTSERTEARRMLRVAQKHANMIKKLGRDFMNYQTFKQRIIT